MGGTERSIAILDHIPTGRMVILRTHLKCGLQRRKRSVDVIVHEYIYIINNKRMIETQIQTKNLLSQQTTLVTLVANSVKWWCPSTI